MSLTQPAAGGLLVSQQGVTLANCRLPVFVLPGHGGNRLVSEGGYLGNWCESLSQAGYACLGLDGGGTADWGGPNTMTALDAAYTAAGRSKVVILAASMNGLGALNWIKRNPTKVQQAILLDPVTDLAWAYGLGGYTPAYTSFAPDGTWAAEITSAYGSWAASAGYRVYDEYASWRGLGVPITIINDTADTTVPPASRTAFVAGVNDPIVTIGLAPNVGHFQAPYGSVDGSAICTIVERYLT